MTKPEPTALRQAEQLQLLVDRFIKGVTWSASDRKDAALLVRLLSSYSVSADEAARLMQRRRARRAARLRLGSEDHDHETE